MSKETSLRNYVLFWVITLALSMSVILTYQSTQYFLEGFKRVSRIQMIAAADMLSEGQDQGEVAFGYHIASKWEQVPLAIRETFPSPPEQQNVLQTHFEDWWYFSPPKKSYSLLSAVNQQGELRYVSRTIERNESTTRTPPLVKQEEIDPMVVIALWGLGCLATFVSIVFLVLRRLTQPLAELYSWAKSIDLEQSSNDQAPNFRYRELNLLAQLVHDSLQKVAKTLAREKQFLGFASHELRTPIATLRNNATLLDKINPAPSAKEREVRDRIARASLTMKGMTETLLWLNRDARDDLPRTHIDLKTLIEQVIDEQRYLLTGKEINLNVHTTAAEFELPEVALHILLTNLIRNAFQHCVQGTILISQERSQIKIVNPVLANDQNSSSGFGLGLKLIRTLVKRFNWEFNEEHINNEVVFTVNLKQ